MQTLWDNALQAWPVQVGVNGRHGGARGRKGHTYTIGNSGGVTPCRPSWYWCVTNKSHSEQMREIAEKYRETRDLLSRRDHQTSLR